MSSAFLKFGFSLSFQKHFIIMEEFHGTKQMLFILDSKYDKGFALWFLLTKCLLIHIKHPLWPNIGNAFLNLFSNDFGPKRMSSLQYWIGKYPNKNIFSSKKQNWIFTITNLLTMGFEQIKIFFIFHLDSYFVWSSVYRWRVYCCYDSINYSNWERTLGVRITTNQRKFCNATISQYLHNVRVRSFFCHLCACALEMGICNKAPCIRHTATLNLFHCFCKNVNSSMKGNQQISFAQHRQMIEKARTERPTGL